ncbi:hypothetical protein JJE66_17960 [Bradyrhizobium diazoefficiens]|uniref:hypothetical protein n=1 Tax=Bradyrhizobium diazoefficiens TaxID=1355477 RepID=UPI00190D63C9|nr:hypothetical protein [Bradyrhizobium diazoefficiens]MBK3663097.1 hypothetical protein [Bradyrhizobium diazoefficiens]
MSALWIGATGAVTRDSVKLFLIGLPAPFAGTWLGLKLFGRINEATFRKVVLLLRLDSGAVRIFQLAQAGLQFGPRTTILEPGKQLSAGVFSPHEF